MTANTETAATPEAGAAKAGRRNEKVGNVVSTKMQKTIVVEVEMRKAHPKYKRIVKSNKKFYAHDERRTISSRAQRFSLLSGRLSRMRTTSPTRAEFCSSWA